MPTGDDDDAPAEVGDLIDGELRLGRQGLRQRWQLLLEFRPRVAHFDGASVRTSATQGAARRWRRCEGSRRRRGVCPL